MKMKCPECGTGKARRLCARRGHVEICSACCAAIRDAECGDCVHYAAARQHAEARLENTRPPDGHFLAEISPEIADTVNEALEMAQEGNPKRAMATLTALLKDHPLNHDLRYGIGTVHLIQDNPTEAIKWFDQAITIFPYCVEAHFNKASAHKALLDVPNFVRSYRRVVEIGDPDDPDVGVACSFLDDFSASVRKLNGISLDEYLKANDLFDQAFTRMKQRDWHGALPLFAASIAIDARNAPCHGNMGLCHAYLGDKAKALAELDRALELDPDYQPAKDNRKVVIGMVEGRPLENAFASTNFSLKQWLSNRKRK